ncbi:hypothetical protein BDZ90DRAFT_186194 [Jaminaea rosea]|uniref:Uncharacterized protein n=1 Tax=Jaminaea rosea TaxID=1569628 RepID=A0A316UT81_9BASI|nr:hypothetical protein BDZ90DRAFT_186194 [Jaminaea rosea]PWN27103.1 hypothetical protein BDZ90DRAFT_186194 [Jaminaea rosea]
MFSLNQSRSLIAFALASAMMVSALPAAIPGDDIHVRDSNSVVRRDGPSIEQLLESCPGGSTGNADKCTFEPDGNTQTVYQYLVSDTISNCDSNSQAPATANEVVTKTSTDSFSFGGSVGSGAEYEGIGAKMTITATYEHGKTVSHSEGVKVTANPGQQAGLVVQQGYTRHTGRVKVQYGNQVDGHYFWYVNGMNQDTVNEGDEHKSGYGFDCGSSPQSKIDEWNANPTNKQFK